MRRVMAVAGLGIVLSACGSTVPLRSQVAGGSTAQLQGSGGTEAGLGDDPGGAVAAGTSDAPADGSGTPGGAPVGGSGSVGGPVTAPVVGGGAPTRTAGTPTRAPVSKGGAQPTGKAGAATTNAGATVANGPGVTATQVSLGYIYSSNGAQEQAALGNTNASQAPDEPTVMKALQDDVNKNGGINGRKLALVGKDYSSTDATATADGLSQTFCDHFTNDTKVLGVFGFSTNLLIKCLGAKGVISVGTTYASRRDSELATIPTFYDTNGTSLDHVVSNLVDVLAKAGYFTTKWDTTSGKPGGVLPFKLGIIGPDDPQFQGVKTVVTDVLIPELAKRGVKVDSNDVVFWPTGSSTSDNAAAVSAIEAAELKFASDNVTNVIPLEVNTLAFFSTSANSQRYYPRYGLNSLAGANAEAGTLVPTAQLAGATGLGWEPAADLPVTEASKPAYAGPGAKHCLDVMNAAGIDTSTTTSRGTVVGFCDDVYSFVTAAKQVPASSALTSASVLKGLETMGSSWQSAQLPVAAYGTGRRYDVTQGWPMAWSTDCTCVQYTGPAFALR